MFDLFKTIISWGADYLGYVALALFALAGIMFVYEKITHR